MTADRAALVKMIWGFFPSQLIRTLVALEVPDRLGSGASDSAELADAIGADPDALHRLLRAASGLGLLDRDESDRWRLTDTGGLLRTGVPGGMGQMSALFCADPVWRSWGELEWSVRTGDIAFDKVTGQSTFEYMAGEPTLLAIFTEAMAENARAAMPGVVAGCDLTGVDTLVDVGGGNGSLLAGFLAEHPALRGILFDTVAGVGDHDRVLDRSRADVVTGDMFVEVPTADAHVIKSVLHDWSDERALAILRRIRAAMPEHGRLFVVEPLLASDTAGLTAQFSTLMSDLNMMVVAGGRERTRDEFAALFDAADLRLVDVGPVPPTGYSILKAVPA